MNKNIKGFFLKNIIELVKKNKCPEGLEKLKKDMQDVGEDLDLATMKEYPYSLSSNLINNVAGALFGDYNINKQYELGKLVGKNYVNTTVGKTMSALFGKNPKNALTKMGYIEKGMGVESKISTEYIGTNSIKVHIGDDPFTYQFHEGFIEGLVEVLGEEPEVHGRELAKDDHEYVVSWQ